jgi:pimeloyl-ACP methyl ester carboxylesterase
MRQRTVRVRGADIALYERHGDSARAAPQLFWAHGWGQSHRDLLPLADAVQRHGGTLLFDLPGFGASPPPPAAWSTADYADAVAEILAAASTRPRAWIGHSFGCRVGLQLAARHPDLVDALFLIAAPGLPPRRMLRRRLQLAAQRWAFRIARASTPEGPARDRLRDRFGSADYRAAGPQMRPVLVKAVNEDLSAAAGAVRCPVFLVYGDKDSETPPDIGERLKRLMPQSRLVVLRGFGHLDIATDGRHQLAQLLGDFLEQFA